MARGKLLERRFYIFQMQNLYSLKANQIFPDVWEFRFCVKIHFGLLKSFDFKLFFVYPLSLLRGEDTFHHLTFHHATFHH